jgi:hypothetical protein
MQSAAKVADKTDRQLTMAQNFQRKARFYLNHDRFEHSVRNIEPGNPAFPDGG